MLITIVIFLFLIAALYERATVLKQAGRKLKVIHFSIMLASFCILVLYSLDIKLPSPSDAIIAAVEAIFKIKG